ncbi:DNA-processing protein DprA [Egbenema bharatensis]|uniref:DNA-processing protein DprA n=1 Tax=Egbenema bharatensis TaxID=3463334 RepID=UPI003A89CB8C
MLLNLPQNPAPAIASPPEIAAYEAIWMKVSTCTRVANLFRQFNYDRPAQVAWKLGIPEQDITSVQLTIAALLPFDRFQSVFYSDASYPQRLQDARHPIPAFYYQGNLDWLSTRSVAVVGTRKPTALGIRRAQKLARFLVAHRFTVMSGLAQGIDTAAHTATLEAGGQTIAVIGTPLHLPYPRENLPLQREIAQTQLLISQVPFYLYSQQDYRKNRFFFLERNKTLAALSEATVIVEASETSGTLSQAEAALQQGRKLFILNSCFERGMEWPNRLLSRGAIRVVDGSEILAHLG